MLLDEGLSIVKGFGDSRISKLKTLDIYTLRELIEYFPRNYENRTHIYKISELVEGEILTFRAKVMARPEITKSSGFAITRVKVADDTGFATLIWFGQAYLAYCFKAGKEYIFTGKMVVKNRKIEIYPTDYEEIDESFAGGKIIPIYSLKAGISQKVMRGMVKKGIDTVEGQIYEFLPEKVIKDYSLCEREFAIKNAHFPDTVDGFFAARRRLIFEELFMLQIGLFRIKVNCTEIKMGYKFENDYTEEILKELPFNLTNSQKKVIEEINNDTASGKVMNRLVQGDVGSGKTAVAVAAAYNAIKNGLQCALMTPTEILTLQHYKTFKEIFSKLDINVVLLTGSIKKSEKDEVYESIKDGSADIVIATQAVIQEAVEFKKLGLVITDEQHRFGVRQRSMLYQKGELPHVMVMTATPIPRTLGLILYGDLDISTIDELPPGRKTVETYVVTEKYRKRLYKFMKEQVDAGRQIYVICPLVEESKSIDAENVLEYADKLKYDIFKEYNVEFVHGKMKPLERQKIMEEFVEGKVNVLVSTTVIEVGVNVPNASLMVIENAERFGLAQLHQLRGRVGRGEYQSYCVLVSDSKSDIAKKRLKVMKSTSDGFEISEKDLVLRGPGDFFGIRQHGLPELKISNLYKDKDILKLAQNAAKEIIDDDPFLKKVKNYNLAVELDRQFETVGVDM